MKTVTLIGSGFSSLSAACYMAKNGYKVTLFEKNDTIGGRARQFTEEGFTFDMGPTFYWMPDLIERFFNDFGKTSADYYDLIRLDPGYMIYFSDKEALSVSADLTEIYAMFDSLEPGSSRFLRSFLQDAEFNYRVAVDKVLYKPANSFSELIMPDTVKRLSQFFTTISARVKQHIKHPYLRQLLEFPVIFLGAKPSNTPLFYCLMNYADMVLGTWHIKGGMFRLADAMKQVAESLGVEIVTQSPVDKIVVQKDKATGVVVKDTFHATDLIISGADYHHTEYLLDESFRNYSETYWQKRVMAPSALLYYVGFDRKIDQVAHHTLFFDTDFTLHAENIYDRPGWPDKPLFYTSFPSITDPQLAPEGKETGIFLIPIAPGITDSEEIRSFYFNQLIDRMENITGQSLKKDVLFYKSYAGADFMRDYNAYKGNAYGLANTLLQTAFLKPSVHNKQVKNLFYTGQLTVPGPGVPPAIISGKIAAGEASKYFNK